MKRHPFQLFTVVGVGIVLCLAVVLWAGRYSPSVTAQEDGEAWGTSAEAPDGIAPERLSPPDSLNLPNQVEAPEAISALVSWRVTGSALKPRENDVSYTVNGNGSCTYVTAGDASTVWNIEPDLPQGTTVDTLRMYYYDTSGSNSSAWFTVYDLYGTIIQEWPVYSSGNSGNSFYDSVAINHTIDYSVYSYLINWRPNVSGSTIQLCGFRIFYEPLPFGVTFLPAIQKTP